LPLISSLIGLCVDLSLINDGYYDQPEKNCFILFILDTIKDNLESATSLASQGSIHKSYSVFYGADNKSLYEYSMESIDLINTYCVASIDRAIENINKYKYRFDPVDEKKLGKIVLELSEIQNSLK